MCLTNINVLVNGLFHLIYLSSHVAAGPVFSQPTSQQKAESLSGFSNEEMGRFTHRATLSCVSLESRYIEPWRNEHVMNDFLSLSSKWLTPSDKSVAICELGIYTAQQRLFSQSKTYYKTYYYYSQIKKPKDLNEYTEIDPGDYEEEDETEVQERIQTAAGCLKSVPKAKESETEVGCKYSILHLGYWKCFGSSTPAIQTLALKVFQQVNNLRPKWDS